MKSDATETPASAHCRLFVSGKPASRPCRLNTMLPFLAAFKQIAHSEVTLGRALQYSAMVWPCGEKNRQYSSRQKRQIGRRFAVISCASFCVLWSALPGDCVVLKAMRIAWSIVILRAGDWPYARPQTHANQYNMKEFRLAFKRFLRFWEFVAVLAIHTYSVAAKRRS